MTHPQASMPCTSSGTVQVCSFSCEATPSVTFGVPPLPVDFVATASLGGSCSDPITFSWDFGDGSALSHERDPSHIYTGEGVFTWTMTATSGELTCSRTGQIRVPCSALACAARARHHRPRTTRDLFRRRHTAPVPRSHRRRLGLRRRFTPRPDPGPPSTPTQEQEPTRGRLDPSPERPSARQSGSVKVVNPPAITLIKKVAPPFKLVVTGDNLQNGIKVYIDETEWTSVAWKSTGKINVEGRCRPKAAVPKGVSTIFRFSRTLTEERPPPPGVGSAAVVG